MARILVVDDYATLRLIFADALKGDGHTVIKAGNGEEALALCLIHDVDLVLTDMSMPKMTGPQLISQLQRLRPSVPIVGMSGGLHPQLVECERRRLGVAAFFSKPMELHDLRRTIEALTGSRSALTQPAA